MDEAYVQLNTAYFAFKFATRSFAIIVPRK